MALPPKIPKQAKRDTRWRSQKYCTELRERACCYCGGSVAMQAAHIRLGTHTGMGQKPDDWHAVGLCKECHDRQHTIGEETFWKGRDFHAIKEAYINASARRADIRRVQRERGL